MHTESERESQSERARETSSRSYVRPSCPSVDVLYGRGSNKQQYTGVKTVDSMRHATRAGEIIGLRDGGTGHSLEPK